MEIEQLADMTVLDCHIHFPHPKLMGGLRSVCKRLRLERMNIVCTPDQTRLSLIPDAMYVKAHYPEQTFVFGGLDISAYFREPQRVGQVFADSIATLSGLGCDGIKMIEAKPLYRKILQVPPFDSPAFEPYWAKLEEVQFPLLMHVNDPQEFWDADKAPAWAFKQGWFYGDGSFINNESQYQEIGNILERHPKLKVIFAHFYFLSGQLERLSELLERYPNVYIDLTPGIEMYYTLSENPQQARDFFIRHQERILFGTDIGARALLESIENGIQLDESFWRVFVVRNFLENDGDFSLKSSTGFLFGDGKTPLTGIGLPRTVLEKIYFRNFERIVSPAPRAIDPSAMVEFCSRLDKTMELLGVNQQGTPVDRSVAVMVRDHFMSLC